MQTDWSKLSDSEVCERIIGDMSPQVVTAEDIASQTADIINGTYLTDELVTEADAAIIREKLTRYVVEQQTEEDQ